MLIRVRMSVNYFSGGGGENDFCGELWFVDFFLMSDTNVLMPISPRHSCLPATAGVEWQRATG